MVPNGVHQSFVVVGKMERGWGVKCRRMKVKLEPNGVLQIVAAFVRVKQVNEI